MDEQHTPWGITEDPEDGTIAIYDTTGRALLCVAWSGHKRSLFSSIVDAVNIAPELLAALEQAVQLLDNIDGRALANGCLLSYTQDLPGFRAILAKARGINTSNCAKCGAALSDDDAHPELCPACTPPDPRKGEYLIPAGARAGSCRSCGADVLWITTAKGSAMPLSSATIEERDGEQYALSHFSDCPQAKGWSKK